MKKIGLLLILTMAAMQLKAETICAIVKIEIRQELSFERQAFDAKMVITNGLDIVSLENLDIDVWFEDNDGNPVLASSDPNNTNAKFFIRVDSMDGVNDINGSGVITAGQAAEIHWLIIPAPGTGGLTPSGLRYGVGATVNYTYGEESQTVNVVPDFITVSPTPLLKLDYFLPADVFGDNPLTNDVEPIEPFDLGLRISNTGAGFADDLKIESSQPKIIENQQGLLIDFELLGTSVNDSPVNNSLLADVGRLDAGKTAMVSWLMQTSLNGEFISFTADFVHSDELGGELTSLIDSPIDTHVLFHRVKVDYTGRDQIRDFLAYDQDVLRVYESNGGDAQVIDESATVSVTNLGIVDGKQKYHVNFTSIAGAGFARWVDPFNGVKQEVTAFRSDGKLLPQANVWQYKIETDPGVFEYYFGLFDVDSTGSYDIIINGTAPNVAPVISVTSPQTGSVGTQLLFNIDVTDANPSDTLTLVSIGAPSGSSISFVSGSTWQFSWLPQQADVGTYNFILSASDQIETTTLPIQVIINAAGFVDSDNDGMDDAWEQTHFGNLDATATGDEDQDSATNLQEFNFGGDPNVEDRPQAVQIISANNGAMVNTSVDNLTVINSTGATNATMVYQYELYANEISENPLAVATVNESNVQTTWTHGETLLENTKYIWRVRAFDGATPSLWTYDSFIISTTNDAPYNCSLDYPINAQVLSTLNPKLSVIKASDDDSESLPYRFELFNDAAMATLLADSGWLSENLITSNDEITAQWQPYNYFHDATNYYWKASVKDELTTVVCGNGEFSLNLTTTQVSGYSISSPTAVQLMPVDLDLVVNHDENANNAVNYSYYFEVDTSQTFASANLQQSNSIAFDVNNKATWSLTGLQNDTNYYWRVRANDGSQNGQWIYAQFTTQPTVSSRMIYALNPSDESWVSSLNPELKFYLDSRIKNLNNFTAEIYSDAAATNLVFSQNISSVIWTTPQLTDRQYYYWKVKANLLGNPSTDYTPLQKFFVIDDQNNQAPSFNFVSLTSAEENLTSSYPIRWTDSDNDSNAVIDLYYDDDNLGSNGVSIASGLNEDDLNDSYLWNLNAIADGDYYLYATISDGQSSSTVYSSNTLKVLHHDIVVVAGGLVTSETGTSITIDVSLNKQPSDYVIVPFSISDTTEATTNQQRLIFNPSNWQTVQSITITGVDDVDVDGNVNYDLEFATIQSNDNEYATLILASITLTNIDDDGSSPQVDLAMEKNLTSTGPYDSGSQITYELIISNMGVDDATNVEISDTMTNLTLVSTTGGNCFPTNTFPCTIGIIAAGSSTTITVVTSLDSIGVFDNSATATASANETDTNLANNTDDTNNGGTSIGANLSVSINNCVNELAQGQEVNYKLIVTNNGNIDLTNIVLSNTISTYLDTITWTCQANNGASCSANNGNGAINTTISLIQNASLTYVISTHVIGNYLDSVDVSASVQLPNGTTDIDNSDNSSSDSDMILDLIYMNGFEVENSSCN